LIAAGGAYAYYLPIIQAKSYIKANLTDPDSAQFRNIRLKDRETVCGEVNAKNRLGGFIGFTKFYAMKFDNGWSAEFQTNLNMAFSEAEKARGAKLDSLIDEMCDIPAIK
jgi:hypothetical protein